MTTLPLITDLFSFEDLQAEVAAGYVKLRQHPTAGLTVANYTASAQYDHHWSNVTTKTRGLIYNTETLEIVSRPWSKFFNIDQVETPTPSQGAAMIRAPKFDGSLGVLYWDWTAGLNGDWAIATRGSFTSDQAIHATRWLRNELTRQYLEFPEAWSFNVGEFSNPFRTYLFEIVYPENRIVVDYGDRDDLVLLDVIDNETGKSDLAKFDELVWDSKAEKTLVSGGFYDTIFSDIPEGEEGFVLYWPHTGVRAKVKAARYIELHRIVFGLSEKSIWQQIANGKSIDDIVADIPDEFYDFVDSTYTKLKTKQLEVYNEILDAWNEISSTLDVPQVMNRKEFAADALRYKHLSKFMFKIFDGANERVILDMIWQDLKPVGDTRMKEQSEDVA
jgi:RNA ligase